MITCSSRTGGATRTRRCATTARPSANCSAPRPKRGVVVKGLMWRSHLDRLQYSEEENQHLGEAIEQRRRRGAAGPARPVRRVASPEARRHPASGRTRARRRVRRRHRPVPLPPRRRVAPRRSAGRADVQALRRPSAVARRAAAAERAGRRRARPHVPGALERPGAAGHAVADRVDRGQVAWCGPEAGQASGAATGSAARAGRTRCRCCARIPMRTSNTTSRPTASAASRAATTRWCRAPGG